MNSFAAKSILYFLEICLFTCILLPAIATGEQLPARIYTVADGLAHDRIVRIVRDSRGFLWFCTFDGLSRYDGSHFTNYGAKEGLPSAYTNSIVEGRDGVYWIATNGAGISRFDPDARLKNNAPLFTSYLLGNVPASNRVGILYADKAGNIWAGTDGGLFVLNAGDETGAFHNVELGITSIPDARVEVQDILEDEEGSLWIATSSGLLRRLPDGKMLHYPIQPDQATDYIWTLQKDKNGCLWLGYERGLIVFKPFSIDEAEKNAEHPILWNKLHQRTESKPDQKPAPNESAANEASPLPIAVGEAVWYTAADGLTYNNVHAIYPADNGEVWIGTRGGGIYIFDGHHFVNYAAEQGISNNILALAEDRSGNIWAGTQTGGAIKIAPSGFHSFSKTDGLGSDEAVSMFEDSAGEFYVITNKWNINRFDGKKFQAVQPNLPAELINSSNARWQIIKDHLGEWWVTTSAGLYRFPKVEKVEDLTRAMPIVYTTREGLADNNISRIFEDSRGDIWLSSYNPPIMLTRWERATNTFHRYAEANNLPPLNWGNAFAQNSPETFWIGLHNGGLAMYRNDNFKVLDTAAKGKPPGIVQGIYFDNSGRLWLATSSGGGIISDPSANEPQIEPLPAADAISSNNLTCFTEDKDGRIYLGSARGIDQLELSTGHVRHYSTNNGLPNSEVTTAWYDRHGSLWFGTRKGVSRLTTETENQTETTPVFISKLKIANVDYPVSEIGQTEIADIELSPNQNQLQIDFFGLDFSADSNLKYQYLLEGQDENWNAPAESRTFTANLKPGSYRFLVRAVADNNMVVSEPAIVSFHILPPVWLRWWFLTLASLTAGIIIYAFYRYRLRRVIEMERIRTRIATDLHDDIGASLSQIAILSEVVRQKVEANGRHSPETEPLKLIAGTSREMIDAMSDIVWAINPHKDNLDDLIHRMRRFASDVLEAQSIDFRFHLPANEGKDISMGADLRREIYVVFKENINNLIKHSAGSSVIIEISHDRRQFSFTITDNGRGFDVEAISEGGQSGMGGNGLPNMRRRAAAMNGKFEITSKIGAGTTVTLTVPIGERRFGINKTL